MPEIEFVDPAAEPGPDEELDTAPRRQSSPRIRRAVRLGAGAVLAVVAGSVLVAALQSHDGGTPAAPGTSGARGASAREQVPHDATSSAPVTAVVTAAGPAPSATPPPGPGPACSAAGLCRTDTDAPVPVLDALAAAFPQAVLDRSSSVLTGSSRAGLLLRSRTFRAHQSVVTIAVVVRPSRAGDTSRVVFADAIGEDGVSVAVTNAHRPWTVVVTVVDPTRRTPDIAPASTLAADPRLLAGST